MDEYDALMAEYGQEYDQALLEVGSAMKAVTGMIIAYAVFGIILGVLMIIAMWKIFKKAGEAGWKAIIPIYNMVILFKISGISPWFVLGFLLSAIPVLGVLIVLGLMIYLSINLSKAFGKTTGFTVGLILLMPIFLMILGFGKSEYVGISKPQQPQQSNP